ncbi:MAG: hypothetical protein ACHQ16_08220, partial [Candidatus Lutacidiplasmatales archaeon]
FEDPFDDAPGREVVVGERLESDDLDRHAAAGALALHLGFVPELVVAEVERECARRGVPVKVVRLKALPHDDLSTRRIVERILERAKEARELKP